jgi:hypothetical protein
MKSVVNWLCDPYLHLILVGLVLVRFAMSFGLDESQQAADAWGRCAACSSFHEPDLHCPQLAAVQEGPVRAH